MKKHIKILSFCFIIGLIFFVGNIMEVKADQKLFTCYYGDDKTTYDASSNQVELRLWIEDRLILPSKLKGQYNIKKYNGDKKNNTEEFGKDAIRKDQEERIFATNQCPEAIVVVKRKTWWVYSGTLEEMTSLQNSEGAAAKLVVIKDEASTQLANISTFNEAVNSGLNKSYNPGFEKPYFPKSYTCTYGDNNNHTWSIKLSENYDLQNYNRYNNMLYDLDGHSKICPTVVFKITNKTNNNAGYVFFGEANGAFPDWPRLCTDYPDSFKCEYLTNTGTYGEYSKPVKEIPWNDYSADFYLFTGFGGIDDSNILTMTASGTNLKLENLKILMNGHTAGLASTNASLQDFINIMATNQNGIEYIGCYDKEKAKEKGWKLLYGNESDFEYYCNFMTKDGVFGWEDIKGDYKYAREGDASRKYDINTIAGANNYFLTLCKDCKSNPSGYGCDSMENAYDIIQNHIFKCRNILGSENDTMKKECENLMTKNLKKWAQEDCFNGRIIVSNSNYGCDTLGGLGNWLSKIYTIIKFAVPILIIAMGIKDFVQALTSGKDDALKKAGNSFIKRLIMGAVFVILPILIEMILTIALGGSFADMCITI